ncbi:C2 family cysteine protease [Lentzea sp. NPDC060358]|uniref:C2 family cysteine protease n=1 Tax=Lentzea sp. NPDC060358 TaxID=3347103 RepID=UPI00365E2788
MRERAIADDRSETSGNRPPHSPDAARQAAADILSLQAGAGNRAVSGMMHRHDTPVPRDHAAPQHGTVQRTPSELREQFAADPLVTRSLLDRLRHPGWNAYVVQLEQYWKIPDLDLRRRIAAFPTTYRMAKRLENAYRSEFGKNELALVDLVNAALERERSELSGPAAARLTPDRGFYLGADEDPRIDRDQPHAVLKDTEPIFTRVPCLDDVLQGQLGDCYLLAAVASIVAKNPGHFTDHIVDNGNGTVTVIFYRGPGDARPTTVVKSVAGARYAKGSLWVQLLEKAYVVSGLQSKPLPLTSGNVEISSAYTQIAGGRPDQALVHLTGQAATSSGVGKSRKRFREKAGDQSNSNPVMEKLKEKIRSEKPSGTSAEEIEEATLQLGALQSAVMELMNLVAMVYLSRQDIAEFVERHRSIPGFDDFMAGLGTLDLPGTLGSGEYGHEEHEAFDMIRSAIDEGRPVVVTTKAVISDPKNRAERDKGLAGEVKVGGLAAGHAYSVLDYQPRVPQPGAPIRLLLRNPWGEYGRHYVETPEGLRGTAEAKGNGQFWLDLGDLVAYFDDISATGSRK